MEISEAQTQRQDRFQARDDLAGAIGYDDGLEDLGMHSDERITCFTCRTFTVNAEGYEIGCHCYHVAPIVIGGELLNPPADPKSPLYPSIEHTASILAFRPTVSA